MQQTDPEGVQDLARLDWEGDPLRIVQKIENWPNYEMVFAQRVGNGTGRIRNRNPDYNIVEFIQYTEKS